MSGVEELTFLFSCAGEEEDGDEDDEAEGATGKRAAEDDEVCMQPGPLGLSVSKGLGTAPAGRIGLGSGTPVCPYTSIASEQHPCGRWPSSVYSLPWLAGCLYLLCSSKVGVLVLG